MNSSKYHRAGCGAWIYYYAAIELNVIETGFYTIITNGTIGTRRYVYENNFNVFNPRMNLISENEYNGCDRQFETITRLQINTTYVLVVTTRYANERGTFSVLVTGPNNVSLNFISEYF